MPLSMTVSKDQVNETVLFNSIIEGDEDDDEPGKMRAAEIEAELDFRGVAHYD
jgi:hypothetical protein